MKARASLSLMALASLSSAQAPPSLAAYLRAHPMAGSLAVSAAERTPLSQAVGLAGYGRKAVRLGTVTAIVPTSMVQFADAPTEPPNLYDGLPRDAKIVYLMSTLTPAQMDRASRDGIGLGDLRGEPRDVFLSILPKRMGWTKQQLGKDGSWGKEVAKGEYDERAVRGVRIRVERKLMLETPLAGSERGYTFHSTDEEHGRPGSVALLRDDEGDFDHPDSYGVTFRRTVPNAPKRGQLDTASLNAILAVPAETTVGGLLALVGAASGREVLADLRVRDRRVSWGGGKARAGDLLDAVALAVTGAYRRVGGAYLLASDVTGLGTRKLRLSIWQQDLEYALRQREALWKQGMVRSGVLDRVGYDEASGLAPSPEMLRRMKDRKPGDEWDDTASYTPALREFIAHVNVRYSHQPVVTDRARARWRIGYRFVSPEGEPFASEGGELVDDFEVAPQNLSGQGAEREGPAIARTTLAPEKGAGLAVAARTPEEATAAVATARRYGFGELWLRTGDAATLRAATGTGFPVRLVLRPWDAATGTPPDSLDRTILGDTAAQAFARVRASEATVRAAQGPVRTGWERDPLDVSPTDTVAALSPDRRAALLALANAPGLRGVVLSGLRPSGYEGPGDGSLGAERQELLAAARLGYTEGQRLAFLRRRGVDPVDLADRDVRFDADLRPPFFLDDALRGSPTVYDGTQNPIPEMATLPREWMKALAEANARATDALLAGLAAPSALIEMPRPAHTSGGVDVATLVPWSRGVPVPSTYSMEGVDPKAVRGLFRLPMGEDPRLTADFQRMLTYLGKAETFAGAFDLTSVPAARWEATLGAWLARR